MEDICKTCIHYWTDFPLPLDHYVPHCEIVDKNNGLKNMDDVVPYPCLECPFDCYTKRKE